MEFREFDIAGPFEIRPRKIEDDRGYFSEVFRLAPFAERAGPTAFVQDNQSLSVRAGTIRGIHFQSHPAAQALLAGLLQGIGERENDQQMQQAGNRLAKAAQSPQHPSPSPSPLPPSAPSSEA